MKTSFKKLPQNKVEITVEVPYSEIEPFLPKAAQKLNEKKAISGFRPGKAPYEIVKKHFGESSILEEALWDVIEDNYLKILGENQLSPLGHPHIEIVKLAPQNSLVYKLTVSLFPKVTIGDISKIKIEEKEVKVEAKDIDEAIKYLAESRSKEKLAEKEVQESDIVLLDMELRQNKVAIEGGTALNHKVIMSEPYYIPGFKEHLLGVRAGEEKTFPLEFPKNYYNKTLAGKKVECYVKIKGVYEREIPKIDDNFAQSLGNFKDLASLKKQIKNNLLEEKKQKEEERQELEMIDKLIEVSQFDEIPEILLKEEVKKMINELAANLANQGIKLEDYLQHLKKKEEDLRKDFLPQAEKRIKIALILSEYARQNKIDVSPEELDKEIEKKIKQYPSPEVQEQIKSDNYRNFLKSFLINQKALQELKKKITK